MIEINPNITTHCKNNRLNQLSKNAKQDYKTKYLIHSKKKATES